MASADALALRQAFADLSMAHYNELRGRQSLKGTAFYLFDALARENEILRGHCSFLVNKLGGDWKFDQRQAHYIIVNSPTYFGGGTPKEEAFRVAHIADIELDKRAEWMGGHMKNKLLQIYKEICQ